MNNQELEPYKVEIQKVVREGFKLYKENFKLFIGVSFLGVLVSWGYSLLTYAKTCVSGNPLALILSITEKVAILPTAFFSIMLAICLYLCVSERYHEKPTTIRQEYKNCYHLFWRYVGTSIGYSLLWVPTIFMGAMVIYMVDIKLLMILLLVVAGIPAAYLGTVYIFAIFATIFENSNVAYFKYSKALIKGNFWRMLIIAVIIGGPKFLDLAFRLFNPWYKTLQGSNEFFFDIASTSIFMFITPLMTCILTVLYLS